MTKDDALKLALEYLKLQKMYGPAMGYGNTTIDDAIIAIKEVLAQPERSWVSLTEDEIYSLVASGYSVETTRLVDKILKGKNP